MFLENKYCKWYYDIVNNAKVRTEEIEGVIHTIIPKLIGGLETEDNLVKLTHREHFLAHLLLTKMTEGEDRRKMVWEYRMMRLLKDKEC